MRPPAADAAGDSAGLHQSDTSRSASRPAARARWSSSSPTSRAERARQHQLCLRAIPDAPEGTWFWIEGLVEATLPEGKLVVEQRIRANDFDPEGTGRAMRVALWDGRVDGARSEGVYRGRGGRLYGGGKLFFDVEKGARAEVVLVLDVQ
jgi:hypothetical protein